MMIQQNYNCSFFFLKKREGGVEFPFLDVDIYMNYDDDIPAGQKRAGLQKRLI